MERGHDDVKAQAPRFVFLPSVDHVVEVKEGPRSARPFDEDIKASAAQSSGSGSDQGVCHGVPSVSDGPTVDTAERHNKPEMGDRFQVGRVPLPQHKAKGPADHSEEPGISARPGQSR